MRVLANGVKSCTQWLLKISLKWSLSHLRVQWIIKCWISGRIIPNTFQLAGFVQLVLSTLIYGWLSLFSTNIKQPTLKSNGIFCSALNFCNNKRSIRKFVNNYRRTRNCSKTLKKIERTTDNLKKRLNQCERFLKIWFSDNILKKFRQSTKNPSKENVLPKSIVEFSF